jgi:hypothetical protein
MSALALPPLTVDDQRILCGDLTESEWLNLRQSKCWGDFMTSCLDRISPPSLQVPGQPSSFPSKTLS